MRAAVLLILLTGLTAHVELPDPAGVLSVLEVALGRLLDGDPSGALAALTRV